MLARIRRLSFIFLSLLTFLFLPGDGCSVAAGTNFSSCSIVPYTSGTDVNVRSIVNVPASSDPTSSWAALRSNGLNPYTQWRSFAFAFENATNGEADRLVEIVKDPENAANDVLHYVLKEPSGPSFKGRVQTWLTQSVSGACKHFSSVVRMRLSNNFPKFDNSYTTTNSKFRVVWLTLAEIWGQNGDAPDFGTTDAYRITVDVRNIPGSGKPEWRRCGGTSRQKTATQVALTQSSGRCRRGATECRHADCARAHWPVVLDGARNQGGNRGPGLFEAANHSQQPDLHSRGQAVGNGFEDLQVLKMYTESRAINYARCDCRCNNACFVCKWNSQSTSLNDCAAIGFCGVQETQTKNCCGVSCPTACPTGQVCKGPCDAPVCVAASAQSKTDCCGSTCQVQCADFCRDPSLTSTAPFPCTPNAPLEVWWDDFKLYNSSYGDLSSLLTGQTTAPATAAPTAAATTVAATTAAPTTVAATTVPVTTAASTTIATTVASTTVPVTTVPITTVPATTVAATTAAPTTAAPTTAAPTTAAPTTAAPITAAATKAAPTTAAPTTAAPTTSAPTTQPATTTKAPTTATPQTTAPSATSEAWRRRALRRRQCPRIRHFSQILRAFPVPSPAAPAWRDCARWCASRSLTTTPPLPAQPGSLLLRPPETLLFRRSQSAPFGAAAQRSKPR